MNPHHQGPSKKRLSGDIVRQASLDAFKKLNPMVMIKNPVMFIVEVGTFITLLLCIDPNLLLYRKRDGVQHGGVPHPVVHAAVCQFC